MPPLPDYPNAIPSVSMLGVPDDIIATIRKSLEFTKRMYIYGSESVIYDMHFVFSSRAIIFRTDDFLNEQIYGYAKECRRVMGPNAPFTLIMSTEPSEEILAACKELRITRIQVYPNPDALDFLAELMFLVATHKFRNLRTGDIV